MKWRRSYDVPPPPFDPSDEHNPARDRRYDAVPKDQLPLTESLKETVARVVPYWQSRIAPRVAAGERLLVAAHGNSLRALIKYLDGLSDPAIIDVNVPTGIPLVYELDDQSRPVRSYYLGNADAVANAQHAVATQGKAR
jgi:2,3-bisphosphoglycerate-dependent phosphoglycerate mutase